MATDRCVALGDDLGHMTSDGRTTTCGLPVHVAPNLHAVTRAHRIPNRCRTCRPPAPADVAQAVREDPPARPPTTRTQRRTRRRPAPAEPVPVAPQPPPRAVWPPTDPEHPLRRAWALCDRLDTAANNATRARTIDD